MPTCLSFDYQISGWLHTFFATEVKKQFPSFSEEERTSPQLLNLSISDKSAVELSMESLFTIYGCNEHTASSLVKPEIIAFSSDSAKKRKELIPYLTGSLTNPFPSVASLAPYLLVF